MTTDNLAVLNKTLDRVIRVLGETPQGTLDELETVLERALIHVMVERQLRFHSGVSALRPVS